MSTADAERLLVLRTDLELSPGQHPSELFAPFMGVAAKILFPVEGRAEYRATNLRRSADDGGLDRFRSRIAIQSGTSAFYAEVEVSRASVVPGGEVPPSGRQSDVWASAAKTGMAWAARVARAGEKVVLSDVVGIATDTNPTLVALAATQATWSLLGFVVQKEVLVLLREAATSSWDRGQSHDPVRVLEGIGSGVSW